MSPDFSSSPPLLSEVPQGAEFEAAVKAVGDFTNTKYPFCKTVWAIIIRMLRSHTPFRPQSIDSNGPMKDFASRFRFKASENKLYDGVSCTVFSAHVQTVQAALQAAPFWNPNPCFVPFPNSLQSGPLYHLYHPKMDELRINILWCGLDPRVQAFLDDQNSR